jgi:hypothetical protein
MTFWGETSDSIWHQFDIVPIFECIKDIGFDADLSHESYDTDHLDIVSL